ncbi:hypothetical protein SASPL_140492 [Salvia splendens]|uniref:Uncharacterized protein n=1 Tax=Salvia splendens TaxID=180675 RepID=A0A8X8WQU8_SALSN|nr:hypothetical protein SASPL_140492 [Salvia splendens]
MGLTEIVQRYHNRAETEAGCSSQVGESQSIHRVTSQFKVFKNLIEFCQAVGIALLGGVAFSKVFILLNIQNTRVSSIVKSFFKLWKGRQELDKPCVDDLSVTDFVHLEEQFETALLQTRATKPIVPTMSRQLSFAYGVRQSDVLLARDHLLVDLTNLLLESLSSLQGKEKLLEEENKMLQEKICASKTKTAKKTLAFDLNALPGGETE